MKKTVILLAVFFLLSCSKDDDGSLPITSQNLGGLWNFKSVIISNGTSIPYVGQCSSQKDYIDVHSSSSLRQTFYYSNCVDIELSNISYSLNTNNAVINSISSFLFDGAIVKKINKTTFEIAFEESRNVIFLNSGVSNCTGIIFEKR